MISIISSFRGSHQFLSNMFESYFTVDNQDYSSVEQFFQCSKASLFNDKETAALILKSDNAKEAKSLGKNIRGFSKDEWMANCLPIMKTGLTSKFSQNKELCLKLKNTAPNILVEGNTWGDIFWGFDLNKNIGKNWLGLLLMEVRNELC